MKYSVGIKKEQDKYSEENVRRVLKKVKFLVSKNREDLAKLKCEKYSESPAIQSIFVKILLSEKCEESTKKAKEICKKFEDDKILQSQLITILMNEAQKES